MKIRYTKVLLTFILLGSIVFTSLFHMVQALGSTIIERIWGSDRFQTAAAIARRQCLSSEYVILTTGEGDDKFADALSGAPLAYINRAPVLLTNTNLLNEDTRNQIISLGANRVIILGGTGVVSDNVKNQLEAMGKIVTRLWGQDRYETAIRIAEKIRIDRRFTKVFLTTGQEFQYAMMAAPFAAKYSIPILFTERDRLTEITKSAVRDFGIREVEIVGSPSVVSDTVMAEIRGMGIEVTRVDGNTMQENNINIIRKYGTPTNKIALARDDIFADALAGAPVVALNDALLLLIGSNSVNPDIYSFVSGMSVDTAYVFGGPGAVSDGVLSMLLRTVAPGGSGTYNNGTSPGNMNNWGITAVQGDWVYFSNRNDRQRLYKSRLDGSGLTRLNEVASAYINVLGNWIYYSNADNGGRIYRISTDGTNNTMLNEEWVTGIIVAGDWIYYRGNSGLCRIKTDGTGRAVIKNGSSPENINVTGDWVYYIDDHDDRKHIYKVKVDGSGLQRLGTDKAVGLTYINGYLYYIKWSGGTGIYKINATMPDDRIRITDLPILQFNIDGDWIYFSHSDENNSLYRININGSNLERLSSEFFHYINIAGDWIYFLDRDYRLFRLRKDGTGRQIVGTL